MPQPSNVIERRAIDFVPDDERHGKVMSMFTLFFAGNMQITAVAVGVIPLELGLGLVWSVAAIVLGNLLGAGVMAAHAVQGPRIGIPQMIQSRAQFGVLGANIPLFFVVIMYLGFFSGSAILGGSALAQLLGVTRPLGILLANGLSLLVLACGHDTIHRYAKWAAWVFTVVFVAATALAVLAFVRMPLAPAAVPFRLSTLLVGLSIFATWQITYGPYVADYSRYLPRDTPAGAVFWSTYAGSAIGSIWAMLVGAFLGAIDHNRAVTDPTAAFAGLFRGNALGAAMPDLALVVVVAGIVVVNALNLYGGSLSTLTIISSNAALRRSALRHGRRYRIGIGLAGAIIGGLVAIQDAARVLAYLNDLLLLLMYIFVPWSAINLADFFLLRAGDYSIPDIYDRDGIYGAWGRPALFAFVVSIGAEIPFMNLPFFKGPAALWLGGADVTWVVGLAVATGAYLYLSRSRGR